MSSSTSKSETCQHCDEPITHFSGRLWHEVGALVFPQYCAYLRDAAGNSYLHEPAVLLGTR